jgi:Leucine-rich repeat (LRR) protein
MSSLLGGWEDLKEVPKGIGVLKNLKVLDLSGNDFDVLPTTFRNLTNLQELFLNDDQNFNFKKSIPILGALPNLRSLHVENDGLKSLPKKIYKISHLESLYLNNNQFRQFPVELKGLKNLQYLDFQNNMLRAPAQEMPIKNFGLKVDF